ncbi:J domain-containing protein [Enterovibrio paralichthyis]|uniref:J domain-containing protein n=1 Tax=Enterovibrio paralichthyis TaxID=2853805 RepID=UPI001C4865E7|nr:J domain-containing protein [Enterovibrio paralichthyis]MBV7300729.1 J domain-containing protein [Enterovibrio paralichthyis]
MNVTDAMNLLNISGTVTQAEIKKAYKAASIRFHPDRNPAGAEMMKAINAAYDYLKGLGDSVTMQADAKAYDFGEELSQVLNQLLELNGITIEICGNWIWVTGDTKPHAKRLGRKEGGIGCYFSKKKTAWYYRPDEYKSRSRSSMSLDEIRVAHGSEVYRGEGRRKLSAA